MVLPASLWSRASSRARFSSMRSAKCSSAFARVSTGVAFQARKPARAAFTAASTWASIRPLTGLDHRADAAAPVIGREALARLAFLVTAIDDRHGFDRLPACALHLAGQRPHRLPGAEFNATRVLALCAVEIARQGQFAVTGILRRTDDLVGTLQKFLDRNRRIGRHRNEGGIRSVLEQPAYEIGQQVAVSSNRRIDAAADYRGCFPRRWP